MVVFFSERTITTSPFATTASLSRQYSIWSRAVTVWLSVTTLRLLAGHHQEAGGFLIVA